MTEIIYPHDVCRIFKCPLPFFAGEYREALAWEHAALANAEASTNPEEAALYYAQAKELKKISSNRLRILEDFAGLSKPEGCLYCTLLPAGLGR